MPASLRAAWDASKAAAAAPAAGALAQALGNLSLQLLISLAFEGVARSSGEGCGRVTRPGGRGVERATVGELVGGWMGTDRIRRRVVVGRRVGGKGGEVADLRAMRDG